MRVLDRSRLYLRLGFGLRLWLLLLGLGLRFLRKWLLLSQQSRPTL